MFDTTIPIIVPDIAVPFYPKKTTNYYYDIAASKSSCFAAVAHCTLRYNES